MRCPPTVCESPTFSNLQDAGPYHVAHWCHNCNHDMRMLAHLLGSFSSYGWMEGSVKSCSPQVRISALDWKKFEGMPNLMLERCLYARNSWVFMLRIESVLWAFSPFLDVEPCSDTSSCSAISVFESTIFMLRYREGNANYEVIFGSFSRILYWTIITPKSLVAYECNVAPFYVPTRWVLKLVQTDPVVQDRSEAKTRVLPTNTSRHIKTITNMNSESPCVHSFDSPPCFPRSVQVSRDDRGSIVQHLIMLSRPFYFISHIRPKYKIAIYLNDLCLRVQSNMRRTHDRSSTGVPGCLWYPFGCGNVELLLNWKIPNCSDIVLVK